jgi:hypothetical protein
MFVFFCGKLIRSNSPKIERATEMFAPISRKRGLTGVFVHTLHALATREAFPFLYR